MFFTRVHIVAEVLVLLCLTGCSSVSEPVHIQQWGTMRQVLREGQTEARVPLSGICATRDMIAVGALEGLEGEVTIIDGEAWIARAPGVETIDATRTRMPTESATLLAGSRVAAWQEVRFTNTSDGELDAIVAEQAKSAGLDVSRPFPFVMEGEFEEIHFHVIRGGCPIANPDGPKPARVTKVNVRGRIVGIHAPNSSGNLTHHTSDVHAHIILEGGENLSGHLDSVRLGPGTLLRLPKH